MKSIFNFRPLFIIFLGAILGAVYYISIANIYNKYWLGLFVVITILLIMMMVYVILGLLDKKSKILSYMNITYRVWLTMFVSVIIFGAIFSLAVAIKNDKLIDVKGKASCVGVVTTVDIRDTNIVLELRDVECDGKKLDSNLILTVYTKGSALDYSVGSKVATYVVIDKIEIDEYNVYNYSAIYRASTSEYNVSVSSGKANIFESIKEKTKSLLYRYMSDENADIGFAMLFGEKEGISDNISNVFSISGISHILAVSGLHIGVLVAGLMYILEKLKANKIATMSTICGVLLFYMILCGFSSSVVRASIMAIVMIGTKLCGYRYDNLSSLSLAGIIIFLFNPFAIFGVGFQLSFACVFAIITIAPTLIRLFEKIHFDNKFTSALSVSVATSIALIPFCAHYFGRISLLSVVTNIFVIPIFSVAYTLLFVITVLGLLFNFVAVILVLPDILIHFIKIIADFVAGLRYSYVLVFDVSMISILLVLVLQYLLEFMVVKRVIKLIVMAVLMVGLCISLVFDFVPREYNENAIIHFNQYYGNMSIILHQNKEVTLVGYNQKDYSRLRDVLNEYHISHIDNVIIYSSMPNEDDMDTFVFDYSVDKIYMPSSLTHRYSFDVVQIDSFSIGELEFEYISNSGVSIKTGEKYRIIGDSFDREDLVYMSNRYYKDICDISVSSVTMNYRDIIDYDRLILQESGEYFANIVLNNQKIWYSNI